MNGREMARQAQDCAEQTFEWLEWVDKIPYLHFLRSWQVKVIPPFAGAMARFHVKGKTRRVSVYLDCYDHLAYFGAPYWEVYPMDDLDADVTRFAMNDTEALLIHIEDLVDE